MVTDLADFTRDVLKKRNINGFQIVVVSGNEGFVNFPKRTILLGEGATKKIALHEIAHIVAGPEHYHYSAAFENAYRILCQEYLKLKSDLPFCHLLREN